MKLLQVFTLLLMIGLVTSCKKSPAGEEAKVGDAAEVETTQGNQRFNLDAGNSLIMWTGSKIGGQHTGTLKVTKGMINVEDGKVVGGKFAIDMTSINCTDLEGQTKADLEGHLKSADFFDVASHPRSVFEITKVTQLVNDPNASHLVYGNLTLTDVTKEIGFKAQIDITDNSITVSTPDFTINRTDFGVTYGSDKFFDNLKDKAISDEIGLSIKLRAS